MSSLFEDDQPPPVTQPDQRLTRAREQEERRANTARIAATQEQASLETRFRSRRGISSLLGGGLLSSLVGSG